MKIELKNIKVNLTFSQETTMFNADIFVEGKKVGYAKNDGHGSSTDYRSYDNNNTALAKADKYLRTLPSTPFRFGDKIYEIDSNLENFIDNAIDAYVKKKEEAKINKKIEKECLNYVVFGEPNSGEYHKLGYTGFTIDTIKRHPNRVSLLTKLVEGIKKSFKEGDVIFNTNIDLTEYGYDKVSNKFV
jgi:hypothetical protein